MIKTEKEIIEILKKHSPDVLNSVYVEEASENKNEDFSYDEGFVADSFGKPLLMIAAGVFYLTTNIITAPFLGAAMGGEILYNKAKEKIKQHIDNKTAEKARKILNADGKLKSLIDKAKQMHGKELSKEDQELFVNIKRTAHQLIKNDTSLTDDEKSAVFRAIGMGIYNANKKPTTEINEESEKKEVAINEVYADENTAKKLKFGEDFGDVLAISMNAIKYEDIAPFAHGASKDDVMKAVNILKPQKIKLIYGDNDEVNPKIALKRLNQYPHIYVTGQSGGAIWFGLMQPLTGFDLKANEIQKLSRAEIADLKEEIQEEMDFFESNESANTTPEQQEAIKNLEEVLIDALIDCTDGPGIDFDAVVGKVYQEMMDLASSFIEEVESNTGDVEYCVDCVDELFKRLGKKLQVAQFS